MKRLTYDPAMPITEGTGAPLIADDEIHLWFVFNPETYKEDILAECRKIIVPVEREREQRYYFEGDRRRYVVTRALVRLVLSNYWPIDPEKWIFSANDFGRPSVSNRDFHGANLSFNISHTNGLIVVGVSRRHALGVDLENIRSKQVSMDIADQYFARREAIRLKALGKEEQDYRLYEYWTLKEAYIKARGMGLSIPLDKFSFDFPSSTRIEMEIDPELNDDAGRWFFCQIQPAPGYMMTLCAERTCTKAPRILARQIVPTQTSTNLAVRILRVSI